MTTELLDGKHLACYMFNDDPKFVELVIFGNRVTLSIRSEDFVEVACELQQAAAAFIAQSRRN